MNFTGIVRIIRLQHWFDQPAKYSWLGMLLSLSDYLTSSVDLESRRLRTQSSQRQQAEKTNAPNILLIVSKHLHLFNQLMLTIMLIMRI